MNAIKNNPYRMLGLFGNSTEKELQKQIATIKRFAEIGKMKAFDYDFPFFGEVVRSIEKVQEAASKIEQAKNKVHYALFWFLNSGDIDDEALNNLKEGNIENATEIWAKALKDITVTDKNFAALSNLSTLQLGIVTHNGSFDAEKFTTSIELKGKLILSDACNSFMATVIGEGTSINRDTILKEFTDEVMQIIKPYLLSLPEKVGLIEGRNDNGIGLYRWENGDLYFGEFKDGNSDGFGIIVWGNGHYYSGHFDSGNLNGEGVYLFPNGTKNIGEWLNGKFQSNINYDTETIHRKIKEKVFTLKSDSGIHFNSISIAQFISSFRNFPTEIRQYVKSKFTDKPINSIESKIETCKEHRDSDPSESAKYGEELFSKTKAELTLLKNILGENDVQYQMIVNKLANEILQCAIDFFNELQDNIDFDPGEPAMRVMKMAKAINPTGQTKSRLDENIENVQEWINEYEERTKNKKIKEELAFIGIILLQFQSLSDSISNTKELLNSCKPYLQKIKKELGSTGELYLNISSTVVRNAQNMLVETVNKETDLFNNTPALGFYGLPTASLENTIRDALDVIFTLGQFDVSSELRIHYNKNLESLKSLASQFSISTVSPKERLEKEIRDAESELKNISTRTYFKNDFDAANVKMKRIKQWQFLRSELDRDRQINEQQSKINQIIKKGEQEKSVKFKAQQDKISNLKTKLKEFTI